MNFFQKKRFYFYLFFVFKLGVIFKSFSLFGFQSFSKTNNFKDFKEKVLNSSSIPEVSQERKLERFEKIKTFTGSQFFERSQESLKNDSSIFIFDEKDLKKSGHDSLSDVLRTHPLASFGAQRAKSQWDETGINTKALRVFETRVLLNGRRVDWLSEDIDLIPLAMVERVEILNQGASSVYGGSAIGGVINIVTKKAFQGLGVQLYQTFIAAGLMRKGFKKKGGEEESLNLYAGFNGKSSSVFSIFSYQEKSQLSSRDRKNKWGKLIKEDQRFLKGYSPLGSPFSFSQVKKRNPEDMESFLNSIHCEEGDWHCLGKQYKREGLFQASPECDPNWVGVDEKGDEFCYRENAFLRDERPSIRNLSYFTDLKTEIFSDFNLSAQFFIHLKEVRFQLSPTFLEGVFPNLHERSGSGNTIEVENSSELSEEDFIYLYYSPRGLKNRDFKQNTKTFMGSFQAEKEIAENLNLKIKGSSTFRSFFSRTKGLVNIDRLKKAIASNTYNINEDSGSSEKEDFFPYQHTGRMENSRLSYVFESQLISKNLTQWKYGFIDGALGIEAYDLKIRNEVDDETRAQIISGGFNRLEYLGNRNSLAAYSELLVPLFLNGEVRFFNRYDLLSDFEKGSFNPKLAFRFSPSPWFYLQTSFGRNFSSPPLRLTEFSAFEERFFLKDIKFCKSLDQECRKSREKVFVRPPSEALQKSPAYFSDLGAFLHSSHWKGGIRYWYSSLKNKTISGRKLSQELLVLEDQIGKDQMEEQYKASIHRGEDGRLQFLKIEPLSQFSAEASGLDLVFDIGFKLFGLDMNFREVSSFVLHRKEGLSGFRRNVFKDETRWGLPYFRNLVTLRFNPKGPWSLVYFANTIGENRRDSKNFRGFYTFHSVNLMLILKKYGEFSLGVNNLHNSIPLVYSDLELNEYFDLYEITGALFYLRYTKFF